VERFDAEPVADHQCPSGTRVDEYEREHPDEMVDEQFSPLSVRLQHDFGIERRVELMAQRRQAAPQLVVVLMQPLKTITDLSSLIGWAPCR